MPSDDRDPKFERALAQHLRGGPAQANCPDAETLAAYHERNLSLEEMAQWKQHISACEACQEALALVEITENQLAEDWEKQEIPVLEAASISSGHAGDIPMRSAKAAASSAPQAATTPVAIGRHRPRPALLRWAIPLGAVAAGVLVFIGIYEQRAAKVPHYSDNVIARRQEPATPGPMLDEEKSNLNSQLQSKDEPAPTAEMSRQKSEQSLPAASAPKLAERTRAGDRTVPENGKMYGVYVAKKVPESAPPPAAPDIVEQAEKDAAVSANAPAAGAAPRPAPPPAPMAYGGSAGGASGGLKARADAKTAPPAVTETVTVESAVPQVDTTTSSMMMKQGVASQMVEVTGAVAGLILTPDNKVFWKLQPAGTVQLTTDGGKTWKSVETGVNADLIAGFAPSSHVCWIAGKAGTLLLTTDRGGHWTRITTPIAGDLGGVHASDAKHASIWDAANHKSYETPDGGATWKQTSNE
jgi:photosynthesis system II assembly factor YCF48-like protein